MKNIKYLLFVTMVIASLIMSACGTATEEPAPVAEEPSAPAAEEPAPAVEEPAPAAPAADERGILKFTDGLAYGGKENLDPVDEARFFPVISMIYDRLTEPAFDSMAPQPSLAESWESNDTGDVWTFHLRQDVKFHDGTPLTSADVAYSADHWENSPTSILASTFAVVDSIETPDDYTIVFNLSQPVVTFDLTVMDYRARVVKKDGFPDVLTTGMGSGPFKLEKLDVGGETVLVANDEYWDGPPGVAKVLVYGIADVEAQTNAMLAGDLDWQTVTAEQAARFEGNPNFVITQSPGGNWSGFVMRTDVEPFNNLALRQAMHLVVDRQEMIDLAMNGAATVSCDSAVSPSDPSVFTDCSPNADVEAAKAKLAEAGYADGFTVDLFTAPVCQDLAALTEIFQQQAAKAGITVNIKTVSPDGYWTEQWMKEPFLMTCWNERLADAALNEIYRGGGEWNESYWNVPEFDALLDAARAERDPEKRNQYYNDAQRMLYEDGGTIIPYYQSLIRVQKACIEGISPLANVWLDWDVITKPASCD